MDRRTGNIFAIALVAVLAVTGGAALLLGGAHSATAPGAPPDTSLAEGVIVGVDSSSLADVRGFDLRTTDGQVLRFSLDALENGAEFPPGHMLEHQATADPVRVWYRDDGATLLAIRVDDAGSP